MARPLAFTAFAGKLRGNGGKPIRLERGQRVYCAVAFDGVDPVDLPAEEQPIAARIFGGVLRFPPRARRCIASVIGGRSGKSYLGVLRLLHLCCTVDLAGVLAPGQRAHAAIVCPDVATAKEALGYFVGACAATPALRGTISADVIEKVIADGGTVESFVFKRPVDGLFIEVSVKAVRQGGANVRGRWYVGALLDEACLFFGDGYKLNDKAVFDAIAPRLVAGGQILLSSTPWLDTGVLAALWEAEYGRPTTAVVAHAPTLELRPDNPDIAEVVAAAYASDPDNADREFGAKFGTGAPSDFLPRAALKAAAREGALAPAAPGEDVAVGGDLGFSRNSSALVVAVRSPSTGRIRLSLLVEERPEGGKLRPSVVCGRFAGLVGAAGARELVADRHYAETAREALDDSGLLLADPPAPDDAWAVVLQALREGLLDLPGGTPEAKLLAKQLASVQARKAAKGRVVIVLPETKDGRHGDLAAAAALAIWAVVRRPTRIPVVLAGADKERAERDARLGAWRRERARERETPGAWHDETAGEEWASAG